MQRQDSEMGDHRGDGVSEVVGFVVILAVIVAAMSLYLTYGLPSLGREGEIKEMDSVRAWFVDYKTGMDQLWLSSPLAPESAIGIEPGEALFNATVGRVTIRKVLNTGTLREKGFVNRYFPLFAPIPASAEVSVRNTERFAIWGWRNGNRDFLWPADPDANTPAFAYTSHNNYWFQQQYYYQLGGVFLRQWDTKGGMADENVTVITAPPISIYDFQPSESGLGNRTKVGIVIVNMTMATGGIGAKSPIRVESRLNADPSLISEPGRGSEYETVSLVYRASSEPEARAWTKMFEGAAIRNGINPSHYVAAWSSTQAQIDIVGPSDDPATNDVILEALIANYTMRLGNVPTMIE